MSSVYLKKKNHYKAYRETGRYGPFEGKNSTETVSEKDLMNNILDKDFKTTVLKKPENKRISGENQVSSM